MDLSTVLLTLTAIVIAAKSGVLGGGGSGSGSGSGSGPAGGPRRAPLGADGVADKAGAAVLYFLASGGKYPDDINPSNVFPSVYTADELDAWGLVGGDIPVMGDNLDQGEGKNPFLGGVRNPFPMNSDPKFFEFMYTRAQRIPIEKILNRQVVTTLIAILNPTYFFHYQNYTRREPKRDGKMLSPNKLTFDHPRDVQAGGRELTTGETVGASILDGLHGLGSALSFGVGDAVHGATSASAGYSTAGGGAVRGAVAKENDAKVSEAIAKANSYVRSEASYFAWLKKFLSPPNEAPLVTVYDNTIEQGDDGTWVPAQSLVTRARPALFTPDSPANVFMSDEFRYAKDPATNMGGRWLKSGYRNRVASFSEWFNLCARVYRALDLIACMYFPYEDKEVRADGSTAYKQPEGMYAYAIQSPLITGLEIYGSVFQKSSRWAGAGWQVIDIPGHSGHAFPTKANYNAVLSMLGATSPTSSAPKKAVSSNIFKKF